VGWDVGASWPAAVGSVGWGREGGGALGGRGMLVRSPSESDVQDDGIIERRGIATMSVMMVVVMVTLVLMMDHRSDDADSDDANGMTTMETMMKVMTAKA